MAVLTATTNLVSCALAPSSGKVASHANGTTSGNVVANLPVAPQSTPSPAASSFVQRPPNQIATVTTLAGDGTPGVFNQPSGLAALADGSLVVADHGALALWRVAASGQVSLLAGGNFGRQDGSGAAAQFWSASDVALAPDGSLVVADGDTLRRVTANGAVTTLQLDGPDGKAVPYVEIFGVAVEPSGAIDLSTLHRIDRLGTDGVVRTLAGSNQPGFADGVGQLAAFNLPARLAWAPGGYLVVADSGNHSIRRVDPDGMVTTLAGSGAAGLCDGPAAQFDAPAGVAVAANGAIEVADTGNNVIRQIAGGETTTLAGSDTAGFIDGPPALAEFSGPVAIAPLPNGGSAIADRDNQRIRLLE
ncbi:MAG: hypothetical protein KGR26_11945 [Cyanobacteria bacterium REEB65]|nr:hypothetical protein [Cyanobacteria bacterium REEB65]